MNQTYLSSVLKRFRDEKSLGDKTLQKLTTDQLTWRPNPVSNSIAIIVQHMHGNMLSRWTNFMTEDGEKSWRKRDEEFDDGSVTKEELLARWEEGWEVLLAALESLKPSDMTADIRIRNQPLSVTDAINRQLAHSSYHVGQIVYVGKWLMSDSWESLSIPKNASNEYNKKMGHS